MAVSCYSFFADLHVVAVLVLHVLVAVARSQVAVAADAETTNLTAGAKLTPPGYISSPSGTFAFGFRALDSDPTKFLLATWFRDDLGSQPQSVAWFAKQSPSGATPLATARSVLSVTSDGALVLADDGRLLWNASSTKQQQQGSVALALADSGNLRLLNDDGTAVWESFWYPTDTLLPGQSLALDDRSQGKLFSKRTATWSFTFDDRARLNYTLRNGTTVNSLIITPGDGPGGGAYTYARMDPDGIVCTYVRACAARARSASKLCRDYCLADCFCVAALLVGGGSECIEVAALTNGRPGNDITTKALVKVRTTTPSPSPLPPPPRTRTRLVSPYKIATICLAILLAITIVGGLLAHRYLARRIRGESQQ
ncbi:hypothetical protein PR202_ga23057 [Eleusine coracana subsp. coracana]|uniref:non-specific serine/threonine protein kinase n=1 Tax=Eleusine coracana subsp. coracana TaxID=191504 RepID=A0AAV5D4B9_ELECO|nr:hypothetical protein PR202_ga23057 [Eleusine coracana subsp. coracana]